MLEESSVKVCVIDPDENNLQFVKESLETMGAQVETFAHPLKGYTAARSNQYGVVISEHDMPYMEGMEILRYLKQSNNLMQIVLMTSLPTKEFVLEAAKEGASGLLMKPLNNEQGKTNIKNALSIALEKRKQTLESMSLNSGK